MTVFVYVNTSKQIGHKDHIKVFANQDAAETRRTIRKALPSNTRFWCEPHRLRDANVR
jgi:hypothetical protein